MKRFPRGAFLCILLFAATGGRAAEDQLAQTPYYPLPVGTTWHYKAGDAKLIVRVVKHEKVGDVLCARLEVSRDDKIVATQHLHVNSDGVYCHAQTMDGKTMRTPTPPVLLLKLPPKKGDGWKIDSKTDGKAFRGAFQIDEKEVKTIAGTYQAVRVRSQDLEVNGLKPNIITYYARGVGMVKQVIREGDAVTEIELEKFEPGK